MSDERRDYGILVTYAMREEAEVAAAALRAEGIDALVAPGYHATYDWHLVQALGGLKVFVPWQKLEEARAIIRGRIADARAEAAIDPGEGPLQRRDRYKAWLVIAWTLGMAGYSYWLNSNRPTEPFYLVRVGDGQTFFAAPDTFTREDQEDVLFDYCLDNPSDRVISPGSGYVELVACGDVLARN